MHTSNISKGVLSVGVWTITRVIVSVLATPFISRALGIGAYGEYAYFLAILFLAAPLANVGTLQTLSRFISERDDPDRRARVALLAGLMSLAGFLVIAIAMAVLIAPDIPTTPPWHLLAILILCLGCDVLWFYARGILYGLHREELAGVPGAVAAILGSTASALFAVAGFGIEGVFTGLLLGNAYMAVSAYRSARRLLPRTTFRHSLDSVDPSPRDLVRFTLSTTVYASLSMMLYKSGVVLVHHITRSHTETALFATALQMAEFVWVLIIAVEGVMLQTTARLWHEGKLNEITALISRIVRYASGVTTFLLTYVFVFADDLIRVYFGPDFVDAAPVLRVLIPGVLSFSLGRLLGPVLHARGNVMHLAAVVGTATLVDAVLGFLLIPPLGAIGAGLSTCVAYGMVLVPYAVMLRHAGIHIFQGFGPVRQLIVFGVTGAAMWLMGSVPGGALARIAAGGLFGGLVCVILALRLHLILLSELAAVIDSLPQGLRTAGRRSFNKVLPLLSVVAGERNASG